MSTDRLMQRRDQCLWNSRKSCSRWYAQAAVGIQARSLRGRNESAATGGGESHFAPVSRCVPTSTRPRNRGKLGSRPTRFASIRSAAQTPRWAAAPPDRELRTGAGVPRRTPSVPNGTAVGKAADARAALPFCAQIGSREQSAKIACCSDAEAGGKLYGHDPHDGRRLPQGSAA
jgi:hypothetical protein